MTELIAMGDQIGALTVLALVRGAKDKHSMAICRCSCGQQRRVRQSMLRHRKITKCASCALKAGWIGRPRASEHERMLLTRESAYRSNARARGREYTLSRGQFRKLVHSPCRYCGETPCLGVDRVDNQGDYVIENCAPCCSICNYAKRDMGEPEFQAWIGRLISFNGSAA